MSEDDIQELVTVPSADLAYLRSAAIQHGVRLQEIPSRQVLEYASAVSCLLAGSSIAITRIMHLLDERNGEQVIDLRPGASKLVYRSKDIQYGLITIFGADGSVSIRHHELRTSLTNLLETLSHSSEKSAGVCIPDIIEAVRLQIENDSEITVVHGMKPQPDSEK